MNRYLAIGYALTAAIFLADLFVLRWIYPVPGENTLLVGQIVHLALIPAAILLFIGTRRSVGRLRKVIGYSLCAFAALGGISACIAIALIASGNTSAVAA
jgi:hypothetical protein